MNDVKPEDFPLARELASIGFPVTFLLWSEPARFQDVYRVQLSSHNLPKPSLLPPVDMHVSYQAAAEAPQLMLYSQLDELLHRAAHEWGLVTALDVVRDLHAEVERLQGVCTERAEKIGTLTYALARAEARIDAILRLAGGEDDDD